MYMYIRILLTYTWIHNNMACINVFSIHIMYIYCIYCVFIGLLILLGSIDALFISEAWSIVKVRRRSVAIVFGLEVSGCVFIVLTPSLFITHS